MTRKVDSMCREYIEDSKLHRGNRVLSSDKFPKLLRGYRNKFCGNFTSTSALSQKSQSHNSEATMACFDLCSGSCSDMSNSGVSSSKSMDICPYCRSSSDCMCSELSKYGKLSRDTHHQTFPHLHIKCNSQLQKFSSEDLVGHVPSDLCRCAKTVTNSRYPSTRANCSGTDGWRAVRLVLLGILVVLPTPTMSSPINRSQRSASPHSSGHHSHHRPMKWINPCRIPASMPTQPSELHMQSQSDEEIFQNIVTQARKAEVQARGFFTEFEHESFGTEHHNYASRFHQDWLVDVAEKVNKGLGEPLEQSRYDTLEVEDILTTMYRGLQKLAVGLEQVVLDQAIYGKFYNHFHEAEFQLKYVLCEFQIAMMEKNIKYEDVTREIMQGEKFTDIPDKTTRTLRDYTIFRDYLNTLEFIRYSFEHFRNQAQQSS